MQEIIETSLWLIGAVVIFTLIYRLAPFKQWKNKKPSFVFFPKYMAPYSCPVEEIISNVQSMGFEQKLDSSDIYARGKAYGDFSPKAMKLHIKIDQEENLVKVYAPYLGVLFDTGDLWSITSKIVSGEKP